jgi:hypothetical protein
MRGLRTRAAQAGIPLPRVRDFNLDGDPAWVVYEILPGVPVPEAGELGPGGPRFPQMARIMGELLAAFRRLPTAGLELDQLRDLDRCHVLGDDAVGRYHGSASLSAKRSAFRLVRLPAGGRRQHSSCLLDPLHWLGAGPGHSHRNQSACGVLGQCASAISPSTVPLGGTPFRAAQQIFKARPSNPAGLHRYPRCPGNAFRALAGQEALRRLS